ncbi:dihydroxyacetone kinase subunit DhaK [Alteribacillus bidgolensis]|uniref:Dihydroxyacetone kinase DhaK subunit n=1 Tax=Alteribacillus bidgolensis TaxID=930129 RepID=A0A1G8M056_9BACI|nr:dihydroxyacetone kinase subunit DhaK [Alteribacillus bidgolensis]SDI60770.1 dihydroxyacetone kinase DhaK subunit [Alteribacillus bidgolensis]
MKKLINQPEQVVDEMLEGIIAAHPEKLKRLPGLNVVVRKEAPIKGKVGLISGGGSGHEPAHAGFVGENMLDAAVAGEVFTSPTPDQILETIKAVDGGKGVLLIVKNYSGDVMNFDMAAEMAQAEGIEVEQVIVKDDIAVDIKEDRRGVAGTIFVHKIAGTAASEGKSLKEVAQIARKTAENICSMGVSLSPSTVPASGKPGFTLNDNEIEIGTGIHGEQGMERQSLKPADQLTEEIMNNILHEMEFSPGEEAAVITNGLGSTPLMELYIVHRKAAELLKNKQIQLKKSLVGEYMTSLEMAGCSITILKLDDQLKSYLN